MTYVPPLDVLLSKHLQANSTRKGSYLRVALIEYELLDYSCQICEAPAEWQGEPITLQLDHINGVNNDHRLENLRFLCPNCHSQTTTWGKGTGKTRGKATKPRKRKITRRKRYCLHGIPLVRYGNTGIPHCDEESILM